MQCNHKWIKKEIPTPNGGYMFLKFCHLCRETEGYGFIDKQHEINYLESLYNDELWYNCSMNYDLDASEKLPSNILDTVLGDKYEIPIKYIEEDDWEGETDGDETNK